MTDPRLQLERLIEAAIEAGAYEAAAPAIALLDEMDGDPDFEPEVSEPAELPPLMDGGHGSQLGRLPVFDRCPCCGREELAAWALPVTFVWAGQPEAVL